MKIRFIGVLMLFHVLSLLVPVFATEISCGSTSICPCSNLEPDPNPSVESGSVAQDNSPQAMGSTNMGSMP